MKTLSAALFLMFFTLCVTVTQAQTVDDVVGKAVTAAGGKDAINGVKTIHMEATVDVNGNDAPDTVDIVNGQAFKNSVVFNGQQFVTVFGEKANWMVNAYAGAPTPTAMPDEAAKAGRLQYDIGGPLMDYAAKGNKVELQGKEDIKGQSAYKLKVTTKDGVEVTVYIDANTGNMVRTVSKDMGPQGGDVTVNYSDFRKVDGGNGFTMAYAQEIVRDAFTLNLTINKVALNGNIDPMIFAMPK